MAIARRALGAPGTSRTRQRISAVQRPPLDATCFVLALAVYLGTRLAGLTDFPIYFVGDEAVQVVDAAQLLHHGFRDEFGDLLPTYLRNGPYLNAGAFVYLQLPLNAVFGYSEFAARALTVFMTLLGAVAVALLLRDVFRVRFWWTGVLLLSTAPAWFLHSRTAFEAPTACSFYAWFLYLYLRFRTTGSVRSLYGSVLLGGLAYYTYTGLKVVVVAAAALFIVSDLRWLATHRAACLRASALGLVLAVPELRFHLQHPGAELAQLRQLGSYVVDPKLSLGAKIHRFGREYTAGLDPRYWYDPGETRDLIRHVMKGFGNLLPETLPFAALGIVRALRRLREPSYRAILLATAAAPLGASLVRIELPRVLVVVIPLTILTALGLDAALGLFANRWPRKVVSLGLLATLVAVNVGMLVDALARGPTWYHDYGLGGLQYGGRQVTHAVAAELERHPDESIVISSAWANATDTVVRFFLPGREGVRVENLGGLTTDPYPGLDRTVFVMLPSELQHVRASGLFVKPDVFEILRLPDGGEGFEFSRLRYSSRAKAIFSAVRAKRRQPITESALVRGVPTRVTHPPFDIGGVADLFDGDTFTLARTADANSFDVTLQFATAQSISSIQVVTAAMTLAVQARVFTVGHAKPLDYAHANPQKRDEPSLELELGRTPLLVRALTLRIFDPTDTTNRHIHVREIRLR